MGRPGNTACDSLTQSDLAHECQDRVTVDAHIWLVCQNPALQRQVYLLQWNQLLKGWSWLCTSGVLTPLISG
jgi:hypothetical protein